MTNKAELAKELRSIISKCGISEYHGVGTTEGATVVNCFYRKYLVPLSPSRSHWGRIVEILREFGDTFSQEALTKGVDHNKVDSALSEEFTVEVINGIANPTILELFALGEALGLWKVLVPKQRQQLGYSNPEKGVADFGIVTIVALKEIAA